MYSKVIDPAGLNLSVNRVTSGYAVDFSEVYTSLPQGFILGTKLETEDKSMSAILVQNAGTAISENQIVQMQGSISRMDTIVNDDGPTFQAKKGEHVVYVVQNNITANAWKGRKIYIAGHPFPYIIQSNDAPASVSDGDTTSAADVANVVRIVLGTELHEDAGRNTSVTIERMLYEDVVVGSTSKNKALGLTLAAIPANNYFWAAYKGRFYKSNSIATGNFIVKTANGGVGKWTIAAGDHETEVLGRFEGSNIINLDIQGL